MAHAGKQHSYHLAKALLDSGLLSRFITSSYVTQPWLQRLILASGNQFWVRRFKPGLAAPYVEANWRFELAEMWAKYRKGRTEAFAEAVYARDEAFDLTLCKRIGRVPGGLFWGFQGSCLHTLAAARQAGKEAWVELATAHITGAKAYLGEEALLHPDWADSIDNLRFSPAYESRLEQEPHLADKVVAASSFTRQTLVDAGVAPEKIIYLPLGFDVEYVPYKPRTAQPAGQPFRFLYAGNVTQRKGMSYLLDAIQLLSGQNIELHIIGSITGSGKAFAARKGLYTYHAPVSQYQLFDMYGQYDALVLPTLFEGFGLVLVEAMAAGLPIITTSHSIGPELVEEGKTGYLVPIRNAQMLAERMAKLAAKPADEYLAMRHAARQKSLSFTWDAYSERVGKLFG